MRVKAVHCRAGNTRAGPAGTQTESRTATCPSPRAATSTQLPPVGPLCVLLTQRTGLAGVVLTALLIDPFLHFPDDLVNDLGRTLRQVRRQAHPLHGEHVAVHLDLLV